MRIMVEWLNTFNYNRDLAFLHLSVAVYPWAEWNHQKSCAPGHVIAGFALFAQSLSDIYADAHPSNTSFYVKLGHWFSHISCYRRIDLTVTSNSHSAIPSCAKKDAIWRYFHANESFESPFPSCLRSKITEILVLDISVMSCTSNEAPPLSSPRQDIISNSLTRCHIRS